MNKKDDFQYYVTRFLTSYMAGQRNLSRNTISSYADTFRLLLIFFADEKGIRADKITLNQISREHIVEFLDWLEETRGVTAATRNIRLAAIHSFTRFVQIEDPTHLDEYRKILGIKNKKCQTREIPYLTIDQVKAILSAPDSTTKQGFRDKVLMTTLYDSAMRVDELIYMRISNVRLSPPANVKITGKGSKERIVPLMGNTAELLNKYIEENDLKRKQYSSQEFLFVNHSNKPLTRAGVAYIIDKYVAIANETGANITIEVHPHIFRHSKAVHLLEAGVELIYIRDILGHTSVKTTEIYARVCNAKKRAALEKAYEEVTEQSEDDWSKNEDLMSWLVGLSKRK